MPAYPLLPVQDIAAWPSSEDGPNGRNRSMCAGPGGNWRMEIEAFSLRFFVSEPWANGAGRDCWKKNVRRKLWKAWQGPTGLIWNPLKLCEFGRLSFQVHLTNTPRNQRERNLLFTQFQVEQDNLFWQPFGVPEMCNAVCWGVCSYPLGESLLSAINLHSLNHAQNKRMLFKKSWRVLTMAFSRCSSASWFNKGLQRMLWFQKNRFPFTIQKALGEKFFCKYNIVSFNLWVTPLSCSAGTVLASTCGYLTC